MKIKIPNLIKQRSVFIESKDIILSQWIKYVFPKRILNKYSIDLNHFINSYGSGVFDYYMNIISFEVKLGECPIIQELLVYLKDKEIRTDEVFDICSGFRKSMINFIYDSKIDSKYLLNEITYIFDENFKSILRIYADTISEKEQEIDKNAKLLGEYKKALDESTLISKTDSNGQMTYVNNRLVKLCGYSKSELIGQKYNIMRHDDMSSNYFDNLWRELKKNDIFRGTIKNRKKNGDYFYIDVTIIKISDPFDELTEYMSISNDVTKLVDARLEANNASRAKEYFLSNMSHEIRTPLNAILGFVNLLMDESISKKHRNYLNIILSSGENLLSIINDILDFSKLRSGEFTIEPKPFSIHDEISHTMELFVASANDKKITITSFINPTIPSEIIADPLRINQILSNFISNAIKFTPSGGVISIEATYEDNMLIVRVKDNGIGIAKKDIKKIFTAFAQAQYTQNKKTEGTGLGLSICNQLAEHMNGHVYANSAVGKGSTFWLEIPIEIRDNKCQIFDDVKEYQALKIVVYTKNEDGQTNSDKYESFLKYSNIFNMKVEIVDNLDMNFDVAMFIHDEIDEEFKKNIIKSDGKYIALMRKISDDYDKYDHIVPMCFPLYCSKIQASFSELLNPSSNVQQSKKIAKKFSGHVLIAEDNEANQELIKIILSKYGLTFELACNGREALQLYKKNNYSLILMDEQMPVMTGNEAVIEIIKYEASKGLSHTPIAALTANVIKGVKEKGLKSGYDSFLGKPIILKELEGVFRKYLREEINIVEMRENVKSVAKIEGLDINSLKDELMLEENEVLMLMDLFLKKMDKTLPRLKEAILVKDYKSISKLAHSIKGSSGNFRIEFLQNSSSDMEKMAKKEDKDYDFMDMLKKIKNRVDEIKIS